MAEGKTGGEGLPFEGIQEEIEDKLGELLNGVKAKGDGLTEDEALGLSDFAKLLMDRSHELSDLSRRARGLPPVEEPAKKTQEK